MSEELSESEKYAKIWRDWYLYPVGFFYFAQGAAFAVIFTIAVYLQNELGVSVEDSLSAQSLILIPWGIKIIFALLSDNVPFKNLGRRRPYVLIAGVLGLIGWYLFPSYDTYSTTVVMMGLFIALSVAIADTIIDSLFVDITPPNRRGTVQGVTWGFRGAGMLFTGLVVGKLIESHGWHAVFYIIGTLMVIGCFVSLLVKEPFQTLHTPIVKTSFKDYKQEFSKRSTLLVTVFNMVVGFGIAFITIMNSFMNDSLGIPMEGIGIGIVLYSLGQFIGAGIAGPLGHKVPLTKLLTWNALIYAVVILLFLIYPFENYTALVILLIIVGTVNGAFEATQMRISMEYSVGPLSGTMYGWYNSISNIAQLTFGGSILAAILSATENNYPLTMQVTIVFLLLSIPIGIKAIKNMTVKSKN